MLSLPKVYRAALSDNAIRPFVACPYRAKTMRFTHAVSIGNPMLEVEPSVAYDHRKWPKRHWPWKITSSISDTVLLNTNTHSHRL